MAVGRIPVTIPFVGDPPRQRGAFQDQSGFRRTVESRRRIETDFVLWTSRAGVVTMNWSASMHDAGVQIGANRVVVTQQPSTLTE